MRIQRMRFVLLMTSIVVGLLLSGLVYTAGGQMTYAQEQRTPTPAPAQAQVAPSCQARLESFYTNATNACLGGSSGAICNAGAAPSVQPDGPVANSLASSGSQVATDSVESISTPGYADDGSNGGLVYLRVAETSMNALLTGGVTVQNLIGPDSQFPQWTSIRVMTSSADSACGQAPPSIFIAQNAQPGETIRVVVNGTSLDISGTVMVTTSEGQTRFVALEGIVRVLAAGQPQNIVAGQGTTVSYNPNDMTYPISAPTSPAPYEPGTLQAVPNNMLDRAVKLPEPGFVTTTGTINLRAGPSTNYGVIFPVEAGRTLTILGRNPAGDWYHVQLPDGTTGWMFAELLNRNHGAIGAVYQETPQPPQRYGEAASSARVSSPSGVTMRSAPHPRFGAVYPLSAGSELNLLARSPYSPWVKVQAQDGATGWVPLINLDTKSVVNSLPVDYDVPLPPEPTEIPGLDGFAFPDPSCFPDC